MIPFNIPYTPDQSIKHASEAMRSSHQHGDGPFSREVSKRLSSMVGGGHALLTPSCTHALEMASMLIDLGPGDEVILPAFTFTSAATAVTKFGATPVFVDVEEVSKGIDASRIENLINEKTRAISWVNYAGVAPNVEDLLILAKRYDLLLIEDNAHGLGGSYKGNPLGSFGDFSTLSFHATKNIQCGEGGALIINNENFIERAEIIREKGTNRSNFVRGLIQKYEWVDHGSSYLLADTLSAILLGQLEEFDSIQNQRNYVFDIYMKRVSSLADEYGVEIQNVRQGDEHTAHMFYFVTHSSLDRNNLLEKLYRYGIQAQFHYQTLPHSKMGMKYLLKDQSFINSERFSEQLLRLPLYFNLSDADQDFVIRKLFQSYAELRQKKTSFEIE